MSKANNCSTTTTAAVSGARVVQFPEPDEHIIPVITGITLLDADAELIARRLRNKSWADRVQYFNNLVAHSIARQATMLEYARSEDDGVAFLKWGLTALMRQVSEVLDRWRESEPPNADAATLFCLSLNPRHRRAAQSWMNGDKDVAQFFDTYVQEKWLALAAFFNLCAMSDICAAAAWRAGPVACSAEFDLPGWMA